MSPKRGRVKAAPASEETASGSEGERRALQAQGSCLYAAAANQAVCMLRALSGLLSVWGRDPLLPW